MEDWINGGGGEEINPLTVSLPATRWAGHDTDIPSSSKISKTVR